MEKQPEAVSSILTQATKQTGQKDSDAWCETHEINKNLVAEAFGRKVYSCPLCQKEFQEKKEDDRLDGLLREKKARIEKTLRGCSIGRRFRNLSFDDYTPPAGTNAQLILDSCRKYAESFEDHHSRGEGLVLIGKPGTGKNHLAAAICTTVIDTGKFTAVHTTVMKLIRRIKATWGRDAEESEQTAIVAFCEPDLLVIDEIGVQFGSDTEKLLLTEVINERYEQMRPTIIISNLTTPRLAECLGERVIDRFRDGGEVLVFDWESYRKSGRK